MEILNGYLTYGVKDIPRSACVTVDSRHELPVIGNSDFVYMVIDENAVYRWDDNELLYFLCRSRLHRNRFNQWR